MNKIVRILFFFKYRSNIATLMSSDKKNFCYSTCQKLISIILDVILLNGDI